MSKNTHRPFGMDEGVHKMCEELFANRYKTSNPTVDILENLTPVYSKETDTLCKHYICKRCGQIVQRGIFNVTTHLNNCKSNEK